jgi:uncharacterized protein YbjT (DUF2867 family)
MNVLVIGASGGSGRAVTQHLLDRGHTVTAMARRVDAIAPRTGLTILRGDATNSATVEHALSGHDAIVVTLGISESPLRVRLRGARETATDVRSRSTRLIIQAAQQKGIRRIVVQSSYGVGPTARLLGLVDRLFFFFLIKNQMDDTEVQEKFVRSSGLDWTIIQPVYLTDATSVEAFISTDGRTRGRSVSRRGVAQVIGDALERSTLIAQTVSVSG